MLIYLQMISSDTDKSAFEQIYNTYRGLMYHVAYARLHHVQDAEDAVHHAFVKSRKTSEKSTRMTRGQSSWSSPSSTTASQICSARGDGTPNARMKTR